MAVLVVIGSRPASGPASPAAATTTERPTTSEGRRTYVVRRGDDLSSVAERFDVPLPTVIELNPRVDPQSVSIGTRLRLRPAP